MLRPSLALTLLALASACGTSRQHFRPAEKASAEAPGGFVAAQYDVEIARTRWGEVRVWSEGAGASDAQESDDTVLHVGFEIENSLDQPLELNLARTRLEDVRVGQRSIELDATETTGQPSADGGSVGQVSLAFVLPEDVSASDVSSFRVRWQVLGPDDVHYEQHTPFNRVRRPHHYPYWGYRYGGWGYYPQHYHWHWRHGPNWCW